MDIRELYETYFSTVYKYIFSISRDVHIAEDVTQETFFKALKHADGFRGDCKLSVWLIRRNMEEDSLPSFSQASENEKNAEKEILLGIRRRIRRKRLAAVLICAACILGAAAAGNYLYYHREVYLPYEETGLRMEGDKLYSDRNWYGRIRGIVSPDQKTEFLVEVETCNVRREYPAEEIPANLCKVKSRYQLALFVLEK